MASSADPGPGSDLMDNIGQWTINAQGILIGCFGKEQKWKTLHERVPFNFASSSKLKIGNKSYANVIKVIFDESKKKKNDPLAVMCLPGMKFAVKQRTHKSLLMRTPKTTNMQLAGQFSFSFFQLSCSLFKVLCFQKNQKFRNIKQY